MRYLLDTHLLIWATTEPESMPPDAIALLQDKSNQLYFSHTSLWEVAIKFALAKPTFTLDPVELRRYFVETEFGEVPISAEHIFAVAKLPLIHKYPFDRLLVAQAAVERLTLLTADRTLASYPGPMQRV